MRIVLTPTSTDEVRRIQLPRLPHDVLCVPNRVTYRELVAQLPSGWQPDALVFWHLEGYPVPLGIEDAACFTAAVVGDWNLGGQAVQALGSAFDLLIADRNGCDRLRALGFPNVAYAALYGFDPHEHRRLDGAVRDLDVAMIGNFNHHIQRERSRWLARVAQLSNRYRVCLTTGVYGDDYLRLMNRAKIVFNHSIRGEANMRAFEAPACGALLFYERENREIRDFFVDRQECVLYGEDDFEELIDYYLTNDHEREEIAEAGYRKVQSFEMNGLGAIVEAVAQAASAASPGARSAFSTSPVPEKTMRYVDQWLACGTAWNSPWVTQLWDLVREARVSASDRADLLNRQACVLAHPAVRGQDGASLIGVARQLFKEACAANPGNVVIRINLAAVEDHREAVEAQLLAATAMLAAGVGPGQLRGPFFRPAWDAFTVELERVFYSHPVNASAWAAALTQVLQWHVFERLSDLALGSGRHELAIDYARTAVALRPDLGPTHFRLARALKASGRLDQAAAEYWRSIQAAPMFMDVWMEELDVLRALNRDADFERCWNMANAIVQACPPLSGWASSLQSMRTGPAVSAG